MSTVYPQTTNIDAHTLAMSIVYPQTTNTDAHTLAMLSSLRVICSSRVLILFSALARSESSFWLVFPSSSSLWRVEGVCVCVCVRGNKRRGRERERERGN